MMTIKLNTQLKLILVALALFGRAYAGEVQGSTGELTDQYPKLEECRYNHKHGSFHRIVDIGLETITNVESICAPYSGCKPLRDYTKAKSFYKERELDAELFDDCANEKNRPVENDEVKMVIHYCMMEYGNKSNLVVKKTPRHVPVFCFAGECARETFIDKKYTGYILHSDDSLQCVASRGLEALPDYEYFPGGK